jgi:hypothetical protein
MRGWVTMPAEMKGGGWEADPEAEDAGDRLSFLSISLRRLLSVPISSTIDDVIDVAPCPLIACSVVRTWSKLET